MEWEGGCDRIKWEVDGREYAGKKDGTGQHGGRMERNNMGWWMGQNRMGRQTVAEFAIEKDEGVKSEVDRTEWGERWNRIRCEASLLRCFTSERDGGTKSEVGRIG